MGFSGNRTAVGCHFRLQGIFPTQGSNQVSRIVGRRFTIWATRDVLSPSISWGEKKCQCLGPPPANHGKVWGWAQGSSIISKRSGCFQHIVGLEKPCSHGTWQLAMLSWAFTCLCVQIPPLGMFSPALSTCSVSPHPLRCSWVLLSCGNLWSPEMLLLVWHVPLLRCIWLHRLCHYKGGNSLKEGSWLLAVSSQSLHTLTGQDFWTNEYTLHCGSVLFFNF